MWRRRVTLAALVALVAVVAAAGALAAPSVTGVRIGEHGDRTRLVLDLTEPARFRIFTLSGPDRIVIDLPPVRWTLAERTIVVGRAGVAQVRFGHFSPETSRIVIDLARPAALQESYVLAADTAGSSGHRLIVDFGPRAVSARRAVARPAEPAAAPAPTQVARQEASAAPAVEPEPPAQAIALPAAQPAAPARREGEAAAAPETVETARQEPVADRVGEPAEPIVEARLTPSTKPVPPPRAKPVAKPRRYLVALDPGHGGRDPGAMGAHGANEKTITLEFARELRRILEASGRYRVVMTRNRDRKVGLHRRVDIVRAAAADIFLSIHVDRMDDRRVRGASVYTLSDDASDEEAAALAARENMADVVFDVDLSEGYDEDVAKVLISLIQQNTLDCSAAFASLLVPELGRVAPLISRPHRFADFRVLKAPDVPSVLIELGYLSNDQDVARLRSSSHRDSLARAITKALDNYFREPC